MHSRCRKGSLLKRQVIPSFLRHLTTLLTCNDENDPNAKRVIAATGSIDPGQPIRILIAAQDPHVSSFAPPILLRLGQKRSLDEVVAGPLHSELIEHITDTWAALSVVDRHAKHYGEQLEALEIFFLSRNFRNFSLRVREDTRLCGGKPLAELIGQWKPNHRHEITRKWVKPPRWLVMLECLPKIQSTRIARGQLEWEFSDKTKYDWSRILVAFLSYVDQSIEKVKRAMEMGNENLDKEMVTLNFWCRYLYYFVTWKAEIVRGLLMKTNMVDSIFLPRQRGFTAYEFDFESGRLEPPLGASKGYRVLRYLWMVVALHAAVHSLCSNDALPELLKDIKFGLVQVPRSPSSVLTLGETSKEFFIRFPDMIQDRHVVLNTLEDGYSEKGCDSDMFFDCVHPEAALIGLLNYYKHYSAQADQDVELENPQRMQQIVQPLAEAEEAVIAVSKECCWCCDWLGQNLESQFTLPGTYGVMYPWEPPKVGVSELVLKKLEDELWSRLYDVVLESVAPCYSYLALSD